ncbi:MAG: hypothetical protein WD767_00730 [Alphaproteobacteria bacterium]
MQWQKFWRWFCIAALSTAGLLYGFVLVVDPYDTLPFSPPLDRQPVATNQRFSYPAVAASPAFDSAVFGTSTTRLLRPDRLNVALSARFANLSMNSGTTYEQLRIFDLFTDHHPAPRFVIFGIDDEWCSTAPDLPRFTFRPFPPWLYDGNPWNDALHLFDAFSVEQAIRQVGYLSGLRPAKYGPDGYMNFLPPAAEYDLVRARKHIYGGTEPRRREREASPADGYGPQRSAWNYPAHARMSAMLSRLPAATTAVLVFVPYHHVMQPAPGSLDAARWTECKMRLTALAGARPNTHVIDFMFYSEITRRDENYWDALHYSAAVSNELVRFIAEAIERREDQAGYYRYLQPGMEPAW